MEESVRYREYAAGCLRAAQEVTSQTTRMALLDMAQTWIMLADHCQRAVSADSQHDALAALSALPTFQQHPSSPKAEQ
jgi:hypothetical protein